MTQQVESRVIPSAKLWGQNRIENKNDHSHVPHCLQVLSVLKTFSRKQTSWMSSIIFFWNLSFCLSYQVLALTLSAMLRVLCNSGFYLRVILEDSTGCSVRHCESWSSDRDSLTQSRRSLLPTFHRARVVCGGSTTGPHQKRARPKALGSGWPTARPCGGFWPIPHTPFCLGGS